MKNSNSKIKFPATSGSSYSSRKQSLSLAGISIPEVAIIGAAGFVLWKNRTKIFSLLEQNGIEVPEMFSGNFSSLVQKGISFFAGGENKSNSRSQMHDA